MRYDPTHVSMLDHPEELELLNVKELPIEPAYFYALLQTLEAIQERALECADSTSSISVRQKRREDGFEGKEGRFC
eukprot:CAMPEP_0170595100 /NCGR_PEP_ID=MMETSP0224-20130122/14366_1 /TAXON_ID=285029 /ORGANISM="Togula jolla, Strain CCCM 725" /LENGTH=75 /DNA_ID=CAMNT_0010919227 /DNA_START=1020 /DNA_END=1247 /DNA_ORIENTATION=-